MRLVLDASMALAWLFERDTADGNARAERALLSLTDAETWVPSLWHTEITNALLVPRSTLFCGSEPTKRAKTALQPLEIVHYSLRATPCLDAPSEL
uniref:PIN domain-containing protein n=1 Tax=Candidatus Kentrum sp. DK TaxID=2126562 RepID=A0A450SRD7_9GAMM|nr:MAG: hypothetical protein BECKDK2373C_GA0170839_10549 [Candidatus Kentron sp. DK]